MNLKNRIKKLEQVAAVAALNAQPPQDVRPSREVALFICNDPTAVAAAMCFAEAYAEQARAPANWAIRGDPDAMTALVLNTDPNARAACETFRGVYEAAVAATAT